jgi:hypothetical protein
MQMNWYTVKYTQPQSSVVIGWLAQMMNNYEVFVQYLVRLSPHMTEVIGSRYQFYCIPVYILPIHLFSIGSKLNGISS